MKNFQDFLQELCENYGLTLQKKFIFDPSKDGIYGALNNDGVYKVLNAEGIPLVLKVAITEKSIAEIRKNSTGYQNLKNYGLERIVPDIFISEINEQFAVMLMEYCGEDFLTQVKKVKDAVPYYNLLITELEKNYTQSKQKGDHGRQMILSIISMIGEKYERYIFMHLDKEYFLAEKITKISEFLDFNALNSYCLASWDFVPENIFLTSNGLKYIDPHEDVMGIPIIDMACFAGLIKLYGLPQAEEGYGILEKFALTKIASILDIPEKLAYKLFYLGRMLQCFLSARFRIISEPNRAYQMFLEGKDCLEKIVTK